MYQLEKVLMTRRNYWRMFRDDKSKLALRWNLAGLFLFQHFGYFSRRASLIFQNLLESQWWIPVDINTVIMWYGQFERLEERRSINNR